MLPLRAAGCSGPIITAPQGGSSRIPWLCRRPLTVQAAGDHRPTTLLHPLKVHHKSGDHGELVGRSNLRGEARAQAWGFTRETVILQGSGASTEGTTHQLVIADGQVRHLPPGHGHCVKAAVGLPAEHPQRVAGPAVQTASIRAEADAPVHRVTPHFSKGTVKASWQLDSDTIF